MFRKLMKMLRSGLRINTEAPQVPTGSPSSGCIPYSRASPSSACEKAPCPGAAIQQTLSILQPVGFNRSSRAGTFNGQDGGVTEELRKPTSRFCSPCCLHQQHMQSQTGRDWGIFSRPGYGSPKLTCTSIILISAPHPTQNPIKSRKQNISQCVSTVLPLHVASGDFFFFLFSWHLNLEKPNLEIL